MEIGIQMFCTAFFSQVTSEKSMRSLKDTFPWKSQTHLFEKCESLLDMKNILSSKELLSKEGRQKKMGKSSQADRLG